MGVWQIGVRFIQPMYEKQSQAIDLVTESVKDITSAIVEDGKAEIEQIKQLNAINDSISRQTQAMERQSESVERAAESGRDNGLKLDAIKSILERSSGDG